MRPAKCLPPFLLALLCAATLHAADPESDVALQRALDQPLTLSLQRVPLSEAFKQIAAGAKIPLQVDPASYDLLPYGDTTQVSVEFKQSRLREALQEVLIPLGLEESVVGNAVLIRPSSALAHIGRKADWEELKLLKELWINDIKLPPASPTTGTTPFSLPAAIRSALDGRKDLLVPLPFDTTSTSPLSSAHDKATQQIAAQLPMSAYRALDMYCRLTNQVWFVEAGPLAGGPTGGTIHILSQRQWIERQLERPISISHTNEPLEVVVADLMHASGIRFVPEPGLYQAMPMVNLKADNASVRRTLESLAAGARIAFDIRDDSVSLHMAPLPGGPATGSTGATGDPQKSDAIIGRISVPVGPEGVLMDVYLHESDLTPTQNELRKKYIKSAAENLQKTWTTPAGIPPAPTPVADSSTTPKKPE